MNKILQKMIKVYIQNEKKQKVLLDSLNNKNKPHPTKPKKPTLEKIRSTGETAFQRAIFNSKNTILRFNLKEERVEWLDLELPIVFSNKARRKCIDLIGRISNKLLLCELKFNSRSDSPYYAVLELCVYYDLILHNCKDLDNRRVCHDGFQSRFLWKDFKLSPTLIIAANKSYWDYWLNKRIGKKAFREFTEDLNREMVRIGISKIFLFKTKDEDFKKQKNGENNYSPRITSNVWEELF